MEQKKYLTNEEKEREAENKFREWLDRHDVPYWYIQQDLETFSPALRRYMSRRPDFMILIPNLGFILTDVEFKALLEPYGKFPVDKDETEKYINLQKYFNIQVWYVFSHRKYHYNTWSWIPAQKVIELGEIYTSKQDNREFYGVRAEDTIQLSGNDGLSTLLSKASFLLK